ncbi:MAG TPA: hypothetical protein VLY82_07460 [Nitrososphaerales archaeon]|nr:hypothetical protein [Nitrososphaerales archaeon]
MNNKALSLLLVALLAAQVSYAATYPLNITPGRSWPLSVVADSSRGLVYFDATSGEYPPSGFSFGIVNATNHDVVKILPLEEYPGAMVLDQASGDVYVAGSTSVAVFDESNQSLVYYSIPGHPILSLAFDSSVSPNLYVTSGNSILSMNPHTGTIMGNVTFSNNLDGIQIDPSNGMLFVGQYPGSEISVLNASDLAKIGTIGLPGCCALQFALDVKGQLLYAATGTNYVYVINAASGSFEKSIEVTQSGQNSTNVILADDVTGRIFVSSSPGGSVMEIDGSDGHVSQFLQVSSQVAGLAVDTKTQELYVANYHQLTVLDVRKPRTILLVALVVVAVVAVGAIVVYLLVRRKDEQQRREIQSGAQGSDSTSRR